MKFKRFTNTKFLKDVGRELLGELFGRFSADLAARSVTMPAADLEDEPYFKELSALATRPDGLPDNLFDALVAVEEMADPEGQEKLEEALAVAGLDLPWREGSSHGDIAIQVFLARPDLLTAKHNEKRLRRLAAFEYFGSRLPIDRSDAVAAPDQAMLDRLASDLDAWFEGHNRGQQTARVEVHVMEGEFWFLVRHGGTFARMAKVDRLKTEVMHFRPAKDDVVVYSPERDELRVHAGTKGERELYRKAFGARLMGDEEYFCERKAYTLNPLREHGPLALDTHGIDGLHRVVLREVEVDLGTDDRAKIIHKADDIFSAQAHPLTPEAIPSGGRVVRAVFDFYFQDSSKPHPVHVRTPNALKLGRHCDAGLVHRWLSAHEYRRSVKKNPLQQGPTHVPILASV